MSLPATDVRDCLLTNGAALRSGAGLSCLDHLRSSFEADARQPGRRLASLADLRPLLEPAGPIGAAAAAAIGPSARPVRALLLDKSAAANWSLGWHQDRTICLVERIDTPGFAPWTVKQGLPHVTPPVALLAAMVTLRVHLDDVDESNAPLRVALGSHRYGYVPETEIGRAVRSCEAVECLALAGDVWLYRTLIIHASARAVRPRSRRVLQVDYAAEPLPNGLRWHDPTCAEPPPLA